MVRLILFLWIALPVLALVFVGWFAWYQAAVQADVYRRQGADLSTWEVLMGAKPITRQLIIEDRK